MTLGSINDRNLYIQAVERQLLIYPASTLKDIYKSFFQDEFGPGHLLKDTSAARRYFDHELSHMKNKGYFEDEPCGIGKNFYRAGMHKVIDGLLSPDDYFNAFIKSSSGFKLPDVQAWKSQWEFILNEILPVKDRIGNFDKDTSDLAEMLGRGDYVAHHSEIYVQEYDPHYRIMRVADRL